MIDRILFGTLKNKIGTGKAIIVLGPRQVGKTTLLKAVVANEPKALWLNADEIDVRTMFESLNTPKLRQIIGNANIVVIDEAQRIPDIGLKLKLIVDELTSVQLIATGSSAFELSNNINESLTGRKWEYQLFPLSFQEMTLQHGLLHEQRQLHLRLIYGYYPDVVTSVGNEKEVLKSLTDSYLYKDILMWQGIKKPEMLIKLLQALAFQVGQQVSYNELGTLLGMDKETIDRYIRLLEQSFVIFRLGTFSRNLRNELKRSRKIYFYDNGIRNALIANFQQVELRQDIGALWENFLISERMKLNHYQNKWLNHYFWRTRAQQEVDYIEEYDGQLFAYEFKWNTKAKGKITKAFTNAYPDAETMIVSPKNYEAFILND